MYKTKSAVSNNFKLFSTPIFSTISSVSLIPALSDIFKIKFPMFTLSSTISLVVPGISVTIAFSYFAKLLSKEDFPTFGFPTMATLIPSFIYLP